MFTVFSFTIMRRGCLTSGEQLGALAPHVPMYVASAEGLLSFQIRDLFEYAIQLLEAGDYGAAMRLADGGGEGVQGLRHIVCLR